MKKYLLTIAAGLVCSQTATAQLASLTASELVEEAARRDWRSVEDALAYIDQHHPKFLENFTLMRHSKSFQQSSPANPRALVFGEDQSLILTFNGDKSQRGYHSIELLQIHQSGSKVSFEFREISFAEHGPAKVSAPNPPKCMSCHGTRLTPIWAQYDRWPGAYGENDDALVDFNQPYNREWTRTEHIKARIVERDQFIEFLSSAPSHPRYRFLKFPQTKESALAPYSERGRSGSFPLRPNLILSKTLGKANGLALASELSKKPGCFEKAAPFLIAELLDCRVIDKWKKPMKEVHDSLDRLEVLGAEGENWTRFSSNSPQTRRIKLLRLSGIERRNWQMGAEEKSWTYFKGFDSLKDDFAFGLVEAYCTQVQPITSYRERLRELYPSYYGDDDSEYSYSHFGGNYSSDCLAIGEGVGEGVGVDNRFENDEGYGSGDYYNGQVQTANEKICEEIMASVVSTSVSDLSEDCAENDLVGLGRKVASVCETCHVDGLSPAPSFSMDEARRDRELSEQIFLRIGQRGQSSQMPPDRPLTLKEERALKAYLLGQ